MKTTELMRADYNHFLRLNGRSQRALIWGMFLNPRTLPVAIIRLIGRLEQIGLLSPLVSVFRLLLLIVFRVEIPKGASIGGGLVLPHPGGIVLGAKSIGRDVIIYQNVTLGARDFDGNFDGATRPTIEDFGIIGCGAVVVGPVTIGEGAQVAANSLVTRDVPPGSTAIGVPAKVKVSTL